MIPARVHERSGRVMGTRVHLVAVDGPPEAIDEALGTLERLEARWSRFRPDSEVARLNQAAGAPVVVSSLTFELLRRAVAASRATGGAFDPTVLPALRAAGYDRDFAALASDAGARAAASPECEPAPAPGVDAIELDPLVGSVRLTAGTAVDVGAIAKGFAADLVAAQLCAGGAAGACVNIGGDLRVTGRAPGDAGWHVAIEREPGDATTTDASRGTLALSEGGVATTSARRRVWTRGGRVAHHVIDPTTGRPADVPWGSLTVVAADAATAEVAATAAFLAPDAEAGVDVLASLGAVGIAVGRDGRPTSLGGIEAFLTAPDLVAS